MLSGKLGSLYIRSQRSVHVVTVSSSIEDESCRVKDIANG